MKRVFLFFFATLIVGQTWAYNFKSGDLYYNITSSTEPYTVEVTYQYEYSSDNYSNLTTADIPEKVTYNMIEYAVTNIGYNAFLRCGGLTSVTIPNSVITIGSSAFGGCSGLKEINVSDDNIVYSSENGVLFNKNKTTLICCPAAKTGSLTIPESVTTIGNSAFSGCNGLTSVTISNSVTSIGGSAFYGCNGLTTVTIPEAVTNIGSGAFYGCINLETVNFNAQNCASTSNTYNFNPFFSGCVSLTTLNIGDNVENIPGYAFCGCSGLTSVNIPNSVTSIGGYAFSNCSGLTSINIGNSVTTINEYAFSDCSSLTSINIPESVTNILLHAFSGCSGLTSVNIGNSVTTIESYVFNDCIGLTTITIPESVTTIYGSAFGGCSNLETVNFNAQNCTSMGGYSNSVFSGCVSLTTLNIGDNVENIPDYAFSCCTGLTSVNISNSVTTIGERAFSDCSGLTTVNVGNSVTTIGEYAFSDCSGLASIIIPESVTNIIDGAFINCACTLYCEAASRPRGWGWDFRDFSGTIYWNITKPKFTNNFIFNTISDEKPYEIEIYKYIGDSIEANVPSSVESDGKEYAVTRVREGAFCGYNNLDYTAYGNAYYIGNKGNPYLILVEAKNTKITACDIHNQCRFIYENAFSGCVGLTEITIPKSVINIGGNAFCDCTNLQKAEFTSIADLCKIKFGNNYSNPLYSAQHLFVCGEEVTDVVIPDSVKNIGAYAFEGCCNLQKTEYASIESLCGMCFENSTANPLYYAHNLYVNGQPVINLFIPETVKSIGSCAFINCTNLASLVISDSVTSIGDSAFCGCSRLASIEIPNSVTEIGNNAFSGCNDLKSLSYNSNAVGSHFNNISALESIFIGDSIKSIVGTEFNGCDNLENVISLATVPPTLNGDPYTFADIIWVPAASVDAYKAAPVWKRKTIMPLDYYTVSVTQNNTQFGTVGGAGNYAAKQAVTVYALPAENYHFKEWSDGYTDNPRTMLANANMQFTAIFEGDERTVSVSANSETFGSVTGAESYHYGDTVTFTASSATGYHFVKWSDECTDNPRTLIVTEDIALSAIFEEDENQGGNNEGNENQGGNNEGNENQGGNNEGNENQGGNNEGNENQGGNENNPGTAVAESAANAINIYAHGNTIIVENATEEIRVYNAMGALICRDVACRVRAAITVNGTGVYIVKTGGTVKRVMVN